MSSVHRLAALVSHIQGAAAETAVEEQTLTETQSAVRERLKKMAPSSYAANVEGFAVLATEAEHDDAADPGQLLSDRAKGAYTWDLDGNQYVDWQAGMGPHILGFSPDVSIEAIQKELLSNTTQNSPLFGRHKQAKLATILAEASDCIDQVLFTNSGTEATGMAMRLARAFTGKDLVATFPGFYHGTHDYALVDGDRTTGEGVPAAAVDSMIQLPYNSPEAFGLIRANADKLALVFIEPVQWSSAQNGREGSPLRAWLHELQAVCKECGVLLGFDETVCGFRLEYGGGHNYFDCQPDILTCLLRQICLFNMQWFVSEFGLL